MTTAMVLVDREALLSELERVFDAQTSDTLLRVLDKVATQVHRAGVSREDFSELKQIVADLAEEQRKLAEEQRKLAEDLRRLSFTVERLIEEVRSLTESQQQIIEDVGKLKGSMLEITYREKSPAYFGPLLRRPKVVDMNDLWDQLEERLTPEEFDDVLLVDLIVKGKLRKQPERGDVYLAVEVSSVIDRVDVKRAWKRAKLLKQGGYQAIPLVAGEKITEGAREKAQSQDVAILTNGGKLLWDKVVEHWMEPTSF